VGRAAYKRKRQVQGALGQYSLHLLAPIGIGARKDELQIGVALQTPVRSLQEQQAKLAQLTVAATGQQRHNGCALAQAQRLSGTAAVRPQWNAISQSMPDAAYRHVMLAIDLFFERKQRQHQVGGLTDAQHALLPPGPDRGADIMHGRDAHFTQPPLDTEGKIRRIDTNEDIGAPLLEKAHQLTAYAQQ